MSSKLIVMTFPHRRDAKTVLKAMETMRKSPILNLDNSVLVTKNKRGCFTYQYNEMKEAQGNRKIRILLSLAQLIFDPSHEAAVSPLIKKGLDDRFMRDIAEVMQEDASALFLLIDKESGFDNHEILKTFALFKGTIHQTSLITEVEDHLSKVQNLQEEDCGRHKSKTEKDRALDGVK